jgi:hypothetical protein
MHEFIPRRVYMYTATYRYLCAPAEAPLPALASSNRSIQLVLTWYFIIAQEASRRGSQITSSESLVGLSAGANLNVRILYAIWSSGVEAGTRSCKSVSHRMRVD